VSLLTERTQLEPTLCAVNTYRLPDQEMEMVEVLSPRARTTQAGGFKT
jgi:hypothetical protein